MLIFPIPRTNDLDGLRRAKVLDFDEDIKEDFISSIVHEEMKDYIDYYELHNLGEKVLTTIKNVAQHVSIFTSNSIQDLQRSFTDIMEQNPNLLGKPVGLVIYNEDQPLNKVQKAEVVSLVKKIIKEVIEELEQKSQSKGTIVEPSTESIAIHFESMIEHSQDDDIITEVAAQGSSRMFVFSDVFKTNIDNLLKTNRARSERTLEVSSFLAEVARLKIEALVSIKQSIHDLFYGKPEAETAETTRKSEPWISVGSSSWPWFPGKHIPMTCKCLFPLQLTRLTGFLVTEQEPCSQPIPWCFVSPRSGCPDHAQLIQEFSLGGIELYWSQDACTNMELRRNDKRPIYFV